MSPTIAPFLWYTDDVFAALDFYTGVFGDDLVVHARNEVAPGVRLAEFTLCGQQFTAMQAEREAGFGFTDAISLFLTCADQAEVDRYWDGLVDGGTPVACGWLTDRYGLRWQVIPKRLMELQSDPDSARAAAAHQAMLQMVKIDVAALDAAADAAG